MKTDTLFYELFQAAPQTFFELLQITPPCPYRFESLTVKTSEKRIDGVLEPEQAGERIYFVEVQATPDEVIYWRTLREVATFFEQRPGLRENDWQAIVLWLNIGDDPGFGTLAQLAQQPMPRLMSVDLLTLLQRLEPPSLVLNVLRPLTVENEGEVRQNITTWVQNIQNAPGIALALEERLIAVLTQLIEQKFRTLTYKELTQMIRLTPLAETISGQELLKDDRVALLSEQVQTKFGISGEVLDGIRAELQQLELVDLKALFRQILKLETLEQLEQWITEHQPTAAAQ
jgi:predicted transposase YdaD